MTATDDVDRLLERYDVALREFYRGDPRLVQEQWSHREDVTLAPPFGPPTHGWHEVAASMERGSRNSGTGRSSAWMSSRSAPHPSLRTLFASSEQ